MKYVVFESINGGGKGTQIPLFEDRLYDSSRNVLISRIRTPNALDDNGLKARKLLKSDGDPYENALNAVKYFGENHKTTGSHIDSLLEMGHDVIGDRNYLSTFAFQHAQGVSYEDIAYAIEGVKIPDLTFVFDVPAIVACERLERRDGIQRRKFDSNFDFLEKVRQNYLELPGILPELIGDKSLVVLNGEKSIEEISEEVWKHYQNL